MTQARATQVDLRSTPYYHCVSRCVRRAFLCGQDPYSGQSYEHRRGWLRQRLQTLSEVYAVDVCAYAIMSNHFHLVLRVDQERAQGWTEEEVTRRVQRLFPTSGSELQRLHGEARAQKMSLWRQRLSNLSWLMRSLNEFIARRANKEDGCKGRFWEGRFKCQPLLDEAALLTCMSYVDLNPVRAGLCRRLEDARFTSVEERLRAASRQRREGAPGASAAPPGLMPFAGQASGAGPPTLPMLLSDYVQLLEWTGRAVVRGRPPLRGSAPVAMRGLGAEPQVWLRTMSARGLTSFGALGRVGSLEALAARRQRRWVRGQGWARRLFRQAA